jgi:hypothetical protein
MLEFSKMSERRFYHRIWWERLLLTLLSVNGWFILKSGERGTNPAGAHIPRETV